MEYLTSKVRQYVKLENEAVKFVARHLKLNQQILLCVCNT